jgi:hypothetical protein
VNKDSATVTTCQGRLVHTLRGGWKGGCQFFPFFIFVFCHFLASPVPLCNSSLAPLHASCIPHHLILTLVCLCLYIPWSSFSSWLVYLLMFKVPCMSFQHGYLLPLWFLSMVLVWFSACASVWWVEEVKVEWILLIAPVCKSRCGAQTISHVYPDSAPFGAKKAYTLQWSYYHCLVLPFQFVTISIKGI